MTVSRILVMTIVTVLINTFFVIAGQAQTSSVLVTGMRAPTKIIYARNPGYFLVAEAGNPAIPNSGRVSIVTNTGERFTVIDGLPSGSAPPDGSPSGPSALLIEGNKLYIAIGTGNETINGPAQGSEIPNPNPNSPIFSSVLEFRFSPSGFRPGRNDYQLTSADQTRLASGATISLGGLGFSRARIRLVANFPDYTPFPRPDVPNNVRNSNPFGLALRGNTLYVADAAQNNIRTVDLEDGELGTLITYPARMNPTPVGPRFIDPVPDSLRLFGNRLLATFLTGFPFVAGSSDVRQYDLESGTEEQLIGGLTSAIDILPFDSGGFCNSFYTLEFSTNMLMNTPGRLQRYDTLNGQPTLIIDTLISPTSMARHPSSGDLMITEIGTGRIMRISNL